MKKQVTLVLEVEPDDDCMVRDDFIKHDLLSEINCACNSYEMVGFKTEVVEKVLSERGST